MVTTLIGGAKLDPDANLPSAGATRVRERGSYSISDMTLGRLAC